MRGCRSETQIRQDVRLVRIEGNKRVGLENGRHFGAILCGGHLYVNVVFSELPDNLSP